MYPIKGGTASLVSGNVKTQAVADNVDGSGWTAVWAWDAAGPPVAILSSEFTKRAREAGQEVLTWVVNSVADLRVAGEAGATGVISNVPQRLLGSGVCGRGIG